MLLGLAYFQLQVSRDPAACLKCTEALRQLETEEGSHPAVSLLAFKAFMALGMLEEAEKEATGNKLRLYAGKSTPRLHVCSSGSCQGTALLLQLSAK